MTTTEAKWWTDDEVPSRSRVLWVCKLRGKQYKVWGKSTTIHPRGNRQCRVYGGAISTSNTDHPFQRVPLSSLQSSIYIAKHTLFNESRRAVIHSLSWRYRTKYPPSMPSNSPVAKRLGAVAAWFRRFASTTTGSDEEEQRVRESLILYSERDGTYDHAPSGSDEAEAEEEGRTHAAARTPPRTNPLVWLCVFIGLGWTAGLYNTYPAPTTVPVFIGLAFMLCSWVVIAWAELLWALLRRRETVRQTLARYPIRYRIIGGLATALVAWWAIISVIPSSSPSPPSMIGNGDKYFIAINLYNSEAIMSAFIAELTALILIREWTVIFLAAKSACIGAAADLPA